MGTYLLLQILLLFVVLWMAYVAWKSSPLMGVITFIFPLAGVVSLFNGDKELRRAFLTFVALAAVSLVILMSAVEEAVEMIDESEGFVAFEEWESEEDRTEARIRWRRAVDAVDYRRGVVRLPMAHAKIKVPEHFRFVERASAVPVMQAAGLWVDSGFQGWLVHETVDLSAPDAWVVWVYWHADGYVDLDPLESASEASLLGRAVTATELGSAEARAQGLPGFKFGEFLAGPTIDWTHHSVVWVESMEYEDEEQALLDCYGLRLGRYGVMTFAYEYAPLDRRELCLRTVRLMAARSVFESDHQYQDYFFLFDDEASYDAAELVGALPQLD